jgi:hypothetical protein
MSWKWRLGVLLLGSPCSCSPQNASAQTHREPEMIESPELRRMFLEARLRRVPPREGQSSVTDTEDFVRGRIWIHFTDLAQVHGTFEVRDNMVCVKGPELTRCRYFYRRAGELLYGRDASDTSAELITYEIAYSGREQR